MTENYTDILNEQWGNIPEPQLLPVGSWRLRLRNASFVQAKEEGQNDKFLFFYVPQEPMDDVDEDALAALGPDYDLAENDVVATFWVERKKDFDRVRKHLEKHGIEVNPEQSISESLKAARNSEIIAYVNQRTFTRAGGEVVTQNEPTSFVAIA